MFSLSSCAATNANLNLSGSPSGSRADREQLDDSRLAGRVPRRAGGGRGCDSGTEHVRLGKPRAHRLLALKGGRTCQVPRLRSRLELYGARMIMFLARTCLSIAVVRRCTLVTERVHLGEGTRSPADGSCSRTNMSGAEGVTCSRKTGPGKIQHHEEMKLKLSGPAILRWLKQLPNYRIDSSLNILGYRTAVE